MWWPNWRRRVFLFRDRAEKSGIAMQYVEAPDIQPVLGDRDRLKQVFINVLDNAIKYSNAGGKIRVEAADMGGHVQIVVSDTGRGHLQGGFAEYQKQVLQGQ